MVIFKFCHSPLIFHTMHVYREISHINCLITLRYRVYATLQSVHGVAKSQSSLATKQWQQVLYRKVYEKGSKCLTYLLLTVFKLMSGIHQFSSVPFSRVWLFATPWIAAHLASLSITSSLSLLKLMPIKSVIPSSHLNLCCPLLLLPPIPTSIWVFSNESTLRMRWPKYWSFSFSISPSNERPGLISFRMDWLDLFAVLGTVKSLHVLSKCNSWVSFKVSSEGTALVF